MPRRLRKRSQRKPKAAGHHIAVITSKPVRESVGAQIPFWLETRRKYKKSMTPRGVVSTKAEEARRQYSAEAYRFNLDDDEDYILAGLHKTKFALKQKTTTWQKRRFKYKRNKKKTIQKDEKGRPLYVDRKTGEEKSTKQIKKAIYGRKCREEINLFLRMHGGTRKEAKILRGAFHEHFDELLGHREEETEKGRRFYMMGGRKIWLEDKEGD